MSNHQKEAELKASIPEFVGPLCKRLKLFKEKVGTNSELEKIIDHISTEVIKTKDIIVSRRNWDRELTGHFGKIERQIDYWVDHNDRMTEWNECAVRTNLMDVLKQLSQILRAKPLEAGTKPREKASDLPQKTTITEVGESSNTTITEVGESSNATITEVGESSNTTITEVGESSNKCNQENEGSMLLEYLQSLNPLLRQYLYSLSIFAENTKLKKRLLIYWWIGLGLVPFEGHKSRTADQLAEIFFSNLVDDSILLPLHIREHNQVIDCCTIEPIFHKQLISFCEKHGNIISVEREEGTWHFYDSKVLLNLDQRYLNSMGISSQYNLHVVQLGSWRYTETEVNNGVEETRSEETKSKDHIEVDETDFLKKLGGQMTYLSLRGISGIEELHESTAKLENLMILDLRACHNLEKLPQKQRSRLKQNLKRWALPQERWFKKLTILDISECYLLDLMPKWMAELSNLEVLKGFVVGREGNKNQSCRLGDLSKLHKLRKLGIRFAKDILSPQDILGLNSLQSLLVLTIIWGKSKYISIPSYSFPNNLEKLDIRCYPKAVATELLKPAKLKNLKKLYIRGGELTEISLNDNWEVEILRLRFLKKLEIDWDELRRSFKNLKYVQYVECPRLKNFPKDGSRCIISEMNKPFQSGHASGTSNQ